MATQCSQENCPRPADCFCLCAGVEVLFCADCYCHHIRSLLSQEHHMHPIATLQFYRIPGYNQRFAVRNAAFPELKKAARSSLGQIDHAIATLTAKTQELTDAIRKHCAEQVEKLTQLKATLSHELEAALSEVEATLYHDSPQYLSRLSSELWTCASDNIRELTLFTYEVTGTPVKVSELVQVKYTSEAMSQKLVYVLEGEMKQYDMLGQLKHTTQLQVNFGTGGSFCRLNADSLLCVGGTPFTTAVYSLSVSTAQLVPLSPMLTARGFAGLLPTARFIYVFGGNWPSITSCEKLDLGTRVWSALPDMNQPRHAFTPCLHEDSAYLLDARQMHRVVETFHLASETFTELGVHLPDDLTGYSATFIVGGELTILTSDYKIARWKINLEGYFRSGYTNRGCSSNCPPFHLGREVLIFSDQLGCVLKFSLDLGAFLD